MPSPASRGKGEGADELPTDGSDMVSRAIAHTLEQQRRFHPNAELPTFSLHGINRIPLERGLGSSVGCSGRRCRPCQTLCSERPRPSATPEDPYPIFGVCRLDRGPSRQRRGGGLRGIHVRRGWIRASTRSAPRSRSGRARSRTTQVADGGSRGAPDRRRSLVAMRSSTSSTPRSRSIAFTQDPELLDMALHDRLHEDARLALIPEVGGPAPRVAPAPAGPVLCLRRRAVAARLRARGPDGRRPPRRLACDPTGRAGEGRRGRRRGLSVQRDAAAGADRVGTDRRPIDQRDQLGVR